MKAFGVGCFTTHAGDNPRGNPIERYTPHAARQTALVSGHDCRYSQSVSQSVTTTLQAGSTWPSYTLLSFCFESSSLSRVRWVSPRLSSFHSRPRQRRRTRRTHPSTQKQPFSACFSRFVFSQFKFKLSVCHSSSPSSTRHFADARFIPSPACFPRWSQPFRLTTVTAFLTTAFLTVSALSANVSALSASRPLY